MSEELDPMIVRQMSILIYNQPEVQQALTAISRAHRVREGLTEAGVQMVEAVTRTALAFASNPLQMAEAINASPTSIEEARPKPGPYPAVSIGEGDIISHGGQRRKVVKVMSGKSEVAITLANGAIIRVTPETQIQLVKPYEPEI